MNLNGLVISPSDLKCKHDYGEEKLYIRVDEGYDLDVLTSIKDEENMIIQSDFKVGKAIHCSPIEKPTSKLVLLRSSQFDEEEYWHLCNNQKLSIGILFDKFIESDLESFWMTQVIEFVIIENALLDEVFILFYKYNKEVPLVFLRDSSLSKRVNQLRKVYHPSIIYYLKPLQPLAEDLDLQIYHQFEKDEVKYEMYKEAMDLAISDLSMNMEKIKILFIGPGNGKLIEKLLSLKYENLEIIAIEKNHKCISTLKDKFGTTIEIFNQDARNYQVDSDIIVSELLGSFGDNELSPEILRNFNAKVMIPSSYSSYLQPIYTPVNIPIPSLIDLKNYTSLSGGKELWRFDHPSKHNISRSYTLVFKNRFGYKVNGFLGWFEADLYGHLKIQIKDRKKYNYCKSWYPIFFPIEHTCISPGDDIQIDFKRINDGNKVWYEYKFNSKIYNEDGANYSIYM